MAIDKAAIQKQAKIFLDKGQVDKAIAELQKIASAFNDGNIMNTIGDLNVRKGDKEAAITEFHKAASVFTNEGFAQKALAVHKKILNINPQDAKALIALGQLHEDKSIIPDAIKYYLAAADVLVKGSKKEEALPVYEKILSLAPNNIALRSKMAEVFSKNGFVVEAAREFCTLGQLYLAKGDTENGRNHLLQAMQIQPSNKIALIELSRLSERSGDIEHAINYVKISMERTGEDIDLMVRLAQLLLKKGNLNEASETLAKVITQDPNNLEARKYFADVLQKSGDIERAWQEYELVIDSLITDDKLEEAIQILLNFKDFDPIENRKKLIGLHKLLGNADEAFSENVELYALYMDKNMRQDALDCLRDAYDIQPDNDDIRQKLENLEALMSGAGGSEVGSLEIGGIDYGSPGEPMEEEAPAAHAAYEETPSGAHYIEEPSTDIFSEVQGEEFEESKPLEDSLTEADIFLRYGLYTEAKGLLDSLKKRYPENIDVRLKLKALFMDTNDHEQAVVEYVTLSDLYIQSGDMAKASGIIQEGLEFIPGDPTLTEKLQSLGAQCETSDVCAPEETSSDDITEDLSEADFYIQQGFFREAADIYYRILDRAPDNEEVKARLKDVRIKMGEILEETPASSPKGLHAETISLEDVLSGDFDAMAPTPEQEAPAAETFEDDVLGIFDEFKKGLEKEIDAEDSETHYNLGIAYKEMGLVEDAIKEFQTSKNDPNFYIQAQTMLGNCYLERGLFQLAAEAFGSALIKIDPRDEAVWSIKYDLALCYDMEGKGQEALRLFTEVYGWNANFREVAEKMNNLRNTVQVIETPAPQRPMAQVQQRTTPTAPAPQQPGAAPAGDKPKRSRVSYL